MYSGIALTGLSGLSMVVMALVPGASVWASQLVFSTPQVETLLTRLGTGVGGALMAGWAVSLWLMLRSTEVERPCSARERARELGRAIFAGILTWFLRDGTVSVALGVPFNAAVNIVYLVAMGLPALALGRRSR